MDNLTLDTWIISDTHFGHKNIVKYCNRPMEHNDLMLVGWRANVNPEDTVLHLGDLAVWYGAEESYWLKAASALPGNKFMLRGNHDKLKDKVYADLGYTVVPEFIWDWDGKRVLFTHAPAGQEHARQSAWAPWDINVHGHIHNNDYHPNDDLFKGRKYINVSVELMDYKPVRLRDILGGANV